MTEPMELLCEYLLEKRVPELVPSNYYWHSTRLLEKRSSELHEALSDDQWDLFEAYMDVLMERSQQELQALFQAALELARELR